MTERLYYTDSTCREFEAMVLSVDVAGPTLRVSLDRTAFYPTSGGQPFDTGVLGGRRVVDVVDADDAVWHVLEAGQSDAADPIQAGQVIRGVIDWPRRTDHMQQHTGQHILSAAFDRLFQARTVAFHLGTATATIDLARDLSSSQVTAAEQEANRIVWDDRPVGVRFATADEARALPLRKESDREGTLRLVEVEGFDLSACGGTHVPRTGAIGIIAVTRTERFKGGLRVEFVCGGRALDSHRRLRDLVAAVSKKLSAGPEDFGASIDRLRADFSAMKKAGAVRDRELAGYRAAALAASAVPVPAGHLVSAVVESDAEEAKALASAIAARDAYIAVIVTSAQPVLVAVACAPSAGVAANEILSGLTAAFGGRGGGRRDLAQAGGLNASSDDVLAKARQLLGT
jgi:alanyl-tRNA synthetase